MNENKPDDRLIRIVRRMDELSQGEDSQVNVTHFLCNAVSRNTDDETIERIIADYEQHIVKYSGEDSMLS